MALAEQVLKKSQTNPKKRLTKAQQKQIDVQNSEMLSDMASKWSLNDPVSNLAEYDEDGYEFEDDNGYESENAEIANEEDYYDNFDSYNYASFDEDNYENFAYNAEKPIHPNSRYSPLKKKVTRGSISQDQSGPLRANLRAIKSKAKPISRPKMSNEELAQARIVRRQATASLANRAVAGMTTQIHITDLLKMVSPAMHVELRKAFMRKDDISSEPMQIANLAEQGTEIPQATVAYVSGYIDDVKFNNGILDSDSNVNMIDGEFFNSLGFNIDQKARFRVKVAGSKTIPIGEKKGIPISIGDVTNSGDFLVIENLGHPIVLGTKWIKQVGGSIDILYDKFQMIVDGETSYVAIQTECICNLVIQDFDTDISTPVEKWHAPEGWQKQGFNTIHYDPELKKNQ